MSLPHSTSFRGLMHSDEVAVIRQAIAEVEAQLRPVADVMSPPWIVYAASHPTGDRLFVATRLGRPQAITAATAEDLAATIRATFSF